MRCTVKMDDLQEYDDYLESLDISVDVSDRNCCCNAGCMDCLGVTWNDFM